MERSYRMVCKNRYSTHSHLACKRSRTSLLLGGSLCSHLRDSVPTYFSLNINLRTMAHKTSNFFSYVEPISVMNQPGTIMKLSGVLFLENCVKYGSETSVEYGNGL